MFVCLFLDWFVVIVVFFFVVFYAWYRYFQPNFSGFQWLGCIFFFVLLFRVFFSSPFGIKCSELMEMVLKM